MSKSERTSQSEIRNGEWAARSDKPGRSVFGNYRAQEEALTVVPPLPKGEGQGEGEEDLRSLKGAASLQSAIDAALARSFCYRYLAQAFEDPTEEGWQWLWSDETQASLRLATRVAAASRQSAADLLASVENLLLSKAAAICPGASAEDAFRSAYVAAFGHAARGRCPLNEIEYGDLKADPLFQPHRLADLAAFYRAFGVELGPDADERHDHICLELEFMTVLAAKEAYALDHQLDAKNFALCREAQKKFLREHLGRWAPAFTRRLAAATGNPTLAALAVFTRACIEAECARFGVTPGSEDLLLRPINEAEESMCASCGATPPPPGTAASVGAI